MYFSQVYFSSCLVWTHTRVLIYVLEPMTFHRKKYVQITASIFPLMNNLLIYVLFNRFTHQVLTKDSVTVSVDAVVYYRVSNATVSIANVENAHHSTRLLAQTTLRNTMGTRHLHEILSERQTISGTMQAIPNT